MAVGDLGKQKLALVERVLQSLSVEVRRALMQTLEV